MFKQKNKKNVVKNYGNYRLIKNHINHKYYVKKKVSKNIFNSKWITICIPYDNIENAKIFALFCEDKLLKKQIRKKLM